MLSATVSGRRTGSSPLCTGTLARATGWIFCRQGGASSDRRASPASNRCVLLNRNSGDSPARLRNTASPKNGMGWERRHSRLERRSFHSAESGLALKSVARAETANASTPSAAMNRTGRACERAIASFWLNDSPTGAR